MFLLDFAYAKPATMARIYAKMFATHTRADGTLLNPSPGRPIPKCPLLIHVIIPAISIAMAIKIVAKNPKKLSMRLLSYLAISFLPKSNYTLFHKKSNHYLKIDYSVSLLVVKVFLGYFQNSQEDCCQIP